MIADKFMWFIVKGIKQAKPLEGQWNILKCDLLNM